MSITAKNASNILNTLDFIVFISMRFDLAKVSHKAYQIYCFHLSVSLRAPTTKGRLVIVVTLAGEMGLQKPWYKSALGRFRTIALCEGVSFLVLLFIAMPLKYFAGFPLAVLIVGWIHGILFILYMMTGLDVKTTHHWKFKKTFIAVMASLIPFGPFVLDKKILSKEKE